MLNHPDVLEQDEAATLTADIREAAQRLFALVERRVELLQEAPRQDPRLHGPRGVGARRHPEPDALDRPAS
jgi:cell fate regulator YaaT (PSP1 superfamily)